MDQPALVHTRPLQRLDVKGPIPILHHLFRHRLPDPGPRRLHHALPAVQQAEIVPDVQIAGPEHELQLMRLAAQDLLEAQVREPRFGVRAVRA